MNQHFFTTDKKSEKYDKSFFKLFVLFFVLLTMSVHTQPVPDWMQVTKFKTADLLTEKYGRDQREHILIGVLQAASFWRDSDGNADDFQKFALTYFAPTQQARDTLFFRFQHLLEKIDGHLTEIARELRVQSDLDLGPIEAYDDLFAAYSPGAHLNDDFFTNKLAFVVLLNFPLKTATQKATEGEKWSRREWAEVRLTERFSKRIPADVLAKVNIAAAASDKYIAEYNIFMNNVAETNKQSLFPKGLRLLSHWNLRDEIKANYSGMALGLQKQRIIQQIMERIVDQSIPAVVINSDKYLWDPYANTVRSLQGGEKGSNSTNAGNESLGAPEPDTRYEVLLNCFKASQLIDQYSPTAPTLIARRFNEDRELPEERVKAMFEKILSSPMIKEVADLIKKRLGRNLEPFDIWYNGFKPRSKYTEEELNAITRKRFPNADAYKKEMPSLFKGLGFSEERANYLTSMIEVDPARGSGHAMGAAMRGIPARLRTRIGADGMDFKGFNIAVHEMGHNAEQTFSLNTIDYPLLQGVPNTAFTEALAFVFQAQDMALLGLSSPSAEDEALKTLNDFWATYEIAGVALVDIAVWRYMYEHPDITPAQLKTATLDICKQIWNAYYAPVFGLKDISLLGIYSHMIHSFLYLPDYPLGHLIAFQIEQKMKESGSIGPEFERVSVQGRIAPDLWMKGATGSPVSADAMLDAAKEALKQIR